jgi:hypothetical protein
MRPLGDLILPVSRQDTDSITVGENVSVGLEVYLA